MELRSGKIATSSKNAMTTRGSQTNSVTPGNVEKSKGKVKSRTHPTIKISFTQNNIRAVSSASHGTVEELHALKEENKRLKMRNKELEESLTKLQQYEDTTESEFDEYITLINILEQELKNLMVEVTTMKSKGKDLRE